MIRASPGVTKRIITWGIPRLELARLLLASVFRRPKLLTGHNLPKDYTGC
jgi:hypothetical protein